MKTELRKHIDSNPRFHGERGLRRLAQELASRETPPLDTVITSSSTRMEQAAAARAARTWHSGRTAYYLSRLLAVMDGRDVLDERTKDRAAELLGLPRYAGRTLHVPSQRRE